MSEHGFTESVVEQAALAWLESIGWAVRQESKLLLANQPRNAPITRRLFWSSACAMPLRGSIQSCPLRRGKTLP
jgi:hypothetical protein